MGHYSQRKAEGHGSTGTVNRVVLRSPNGNVTLLAKKDGSGVNHLYTKVGDATEVKVLNLTTLAAAGSSSEAPVGSLVQYAGDAPAPTGWLMADGSTISKTGTYSDLFAVIGYKYDTSLSGDSFRLPDMRGSFPAGKSSSPPFDTLGNTGGSKDSVNVEHTHNVGGQNAAISGTTNFTGTVSNGAVSGDLDSGTVSGGTVDIGHGHAVSSTGGGAVKRTLTGTVSSSMGNYTVAGSGTLFLTECTVGHQIQVGTSGGSNGDGWFTIASITSNIELATTETGSGESAGTFAYCWPRAKPNDESLAVTGRMIKMTGTVGCTGTSVSGTGTSFKTDISNGWWINFGNDDTQWRQVDYVIDDDSLVLTSSITVSSGTSWYGLPRAFAQNYDEGTLEGTHPDKYFTERHDFGSVSYPGGEYTHAGESSATQFPPSLEVFAPWYYPTLNTESIGYVSVGASLLATSSDYYDANNDLWMGAQFSTGSGHSTEGNTPFDVDEFIGHQGLCEFTGGVGTAWLNSYNTTSGGSLGETGTADDWYWDGVTYSYFHPSAAGHEHDHATELIDAHIASPYNCPEFKGASFFSSSYPFDDGRIITEIKKYGVNGTNNASEAHIDRPTAPVFGDIYSEVGGDNLPDAGACVEIRDSGSSGASLTITDHSGSVSVTGASVATGVTASLSNTEVTGSGDTGGTAAVIASTTTGSGTGDGTDANLPPYVVLNYIIKY